MWRKFICIILFHRYLQSEQLKAKTNVETGTVFVPGPKINNYLTCISNSKQKCNISAVEPAVLDPELHLKESTRNLQIKQENKDQQLGQCKV